MFRQHACLTLSSRMLKTWIGYILKQTFPADKIYPPAGYMADLKLFEEMAGKPLPQTIFPHVPQGRGGTL